MPLEDLALTLTIVFGAVAAAMAVVGLLGVLGSLRFVHCTRCPRWALVSPRNAGEPTCLRCRMAGLAHQPAGHLHGIHLGHRRG